MYGNVCQHGLKQEEFSMKDKNWMASAVSKPGALKQTAKREGALTPKGTIQKKWLHKKATGSGVTAKRARLALTFDRFRKS